jgi:hypothetical protein
MKAALTTCNFTLGDEIPTYESINHAGMISGLGNADAGSTASARAEANSELKAAIKKSSIHFGQEKVNIYLILILEYH